MSVCREEKFCIVLCYEYELRSRKDYNIHSLSALRTEKQLPLTYHEFSGIDEKCLLEKEKKESVNTKGEFPLLVSGSGYSHI